MLLLQRLKGIKINYKLLFLPIDSFVDMNDHTHSIELIFPLFSPQNTYLSNNSICNHTIYL